MYQAAFMFRPGSTDADFEALGLEPSPQIGWNDVGSFGNEIVAGAKSVGVLLFGKAAAAVKSVGSLDIVGENERESLALRPAGPVRGRGGGIGFDRPNVTAGRRLRSATQPAHRHAQAPREVRFEMVIEASAKHGGEAGGE